MTINNKRCFASWSGGKDSCLALFHAIKNGGKPEILLTMMIENGTRSRAHGLPLHIIQSQSDSLGIPFETRCASWQHYEEEFINVASEFRQRGIEFGIFGDIDLDPNLKWVEKVCSTAGIQVYEPLWKRSRRSLLDEFLSNGFKAAVISIKNGALGKEVLGQTLTQELISFFESQGVDASGEQGEYHTLVTDGPIFSTPVRFTQKSVVTRDGYHFLDIEGL